MPRRIATARPAFAGSPQANRAARSRRYDQTPQRKADLAFYNSARWRKLKAEKLADDPVCERCKADGRIVAATHVHHKVERHIDPARELDKTNLESLCAPCHSAHHAQGGFGQRGQRSW
jgi:5-methylcytosine-specific restriction endonuclease McrA